METSDFLPGDIVIANVPPQGEILCLYATQEPDKTHKLLVPDEQGKLHVLYVRQNEPLRQYQRPAFFSNKKWYSTEAIAIANENLKTP